MTLKSGKHNIRIKKKHSRKQQIGISISSIKLLFFLEVSVKKKIEYHFGI